jgi:Protein of unknown function (DUF3464).
MMRTNNNIVEAFTPSIRNNWMVLVPIRSSRHMTRLYETKKGFGKSRESPKTTSGSSTQSTAPTTAATTTTTTPFSKEKKEGPGEPLEQSVTAEYSTSTPGGAEALSRLRRQKAEQRNEELRRIRELKSVDRLLSEEPNAAVIPEKVAQRMGKRMLPFVGIPLFGVMGAFVVFWYLATYKNYEFQPALVAFSTIGILGVGLLGITYSVMSASWDVEEEGSALGWDEFQKNLNSIQDGLKRTRENAILREKMSSLPQDEINDALQRFEKKEKAEMKKTMNLKERFEKDME